jgi:hypothetical protein
MTRGEREPDALDLWFARQRRAWWRTWRWAVVPLIALAALRTLYVGVWAVLAYTWEREALVFSPPDWQYSWVGTMLYLCDAQMYSAWLLAAGAAFVIAGELSLDGSLRAVHGVLPMALEARAQGLKGVIVPADNAPEAAVISGAGDAGSVPLLHH